MIATKILNRVQEKSILKLLDENSSAKWSTGEKPTKLSLIKKYQFGYTLFFDNKELSHGQLYHQPFNKSRLLTHFQFVQAVIRGML